MQFENTTWYQLVVISDVSTNLAKRINCGEPFDVFVGTPAQIDGLIKDIIAATRTNLVRSRDGRTHNAFALPLFRPIVAVGLPSGIVSSGDTMP